MCVIGVMGSENVIRMFLVHKAKNASFHGFSIKYLAHWSTHEREEL